MTDTLKIGDTVILPVDVKRTFWEWLTRKPRRTEQRQFKIVDVYPKEKGNEE